jgi:hypothetical protein
MAKSGKRQRRLEIDVDRYQELLDSIDVTPAPKEQVLRAIWAISLMAIDLGLAVHHAPTSPSE